MRSVVILLALSVAALAAQGRWEAPYRKGTDAIKARKWQEAITNLESAVRFDSKEEAHKTSEGSFGTDYFPYYYLGVAHLRLGHFDKAEEYLQLAAKDRISKLQPLIAAAESELVAARPKPQPTNTLPTPAPPPPKPNSTSAPSVNPPPNTVTTPPANTTPPAPNPPPTKPAEPAKPAVDPKFEPLARSAQTALDTRRFADAMQRFDELKALDPAEYARRGFGLRRIEAARLDEIRRRELAAAAEPKSPAPVPAPPPAIVPPPPPPVPAPSPVIAPPDFTVVPLHEALLEYFKGNVGGTIALLEPAANADNGTMDKRVRAPLHAYLAAAYADRALVARADDEKKKLEGQAMAQFKIALDAAPDFQLSETAVSPAIREFLKKAVGRRP